ncbi:MAG: peptide chain release factor N(5)-glutamine methyltransferase, partial [Planctomycetes bacterium]|nr:peptide chain release factor N(5)-glutamine methyltransferase [Planctomycetota bacterium]
MTSESEPWTIGRLIEWTANFLKDSGVDAPRLATELLLADTLGCERIQLYARFDTTPSSDQLTAFRQNVRQAAKHHPIAYLLGKKDFFSLEFEVTPAVLIPRPATEVLVEQVIQHCRSLEQDRIDILDLGTGSGCVGLALCRHLENAQVVGSDISHAALLVASRNAERLDSLERFKTLQA